MDTVDKRGRGRPATGSTTVMVRIPGALKPAVVELVATYRRAKVKAWEAAPLRPVEPQQPDREPQP